MHIRPSLRRIVAAIPVVFVAITPPASSEAQAAPEVTAQDYARAERMLGASTNPLISGVAGSPTWLPDGRFWYRVSTQDGADHMLVDPRRKTRQPLFDATRLTRALGAVGGSDVNLARLSPTALSVSDDGRTVMIRTSKRFSCDVSAYTCSEQSDPRSRQTPPNARVSPDGRLAAYIRDYNLWVTDLETGKETQLTTDGIKDFGYATNNAGWTHSANPVLTWSPDSKQIATFQHDERGVRDMHLVTTNVGSPRLESWKYPLPGDSVIFRISRVILRAGADGTWSMVRLKMPPDAHRSTVSDHVACGGEICDVRWYPDGSHLAFISSTRDHKTMWMRVANAASGDVRTLFEEKSTTQLGDASLDDGLWQVLPKTNELIMWSQRDNWVHLYLYDLGTGQLKNRITTGDGNVTSIVRIDEKARMIYFMGVGREANRDPYFQHFYRVGFDGKGLALLTPEVANHVVALSPDGSHFVDTYSTPDTPQTTVIRDAKGQLQQSLEKADISRLVASGWTPPIPVRMKARDGTTDIYGLMFTPAKLDSSRKYPIVNYIYPGPQSGSVGTRNFGASRNDHQAVAELGFVVVAIDGMGTPGRSKTFHDAYYGKMGDNTLPDQIAGMRQLAERYRFIDIERVGIWGHSGGGFATAAALFRYPDFFDVGISESGNHDNRNYEDDWGERYQGLLVRNGDTDNYAEEANQTHAKNLKGKLFLAHGGMDDNVPPYNTQLVVDALIKAGKEFDLLTLPNARHGFGADGAYMMRRRWDYFVRNLIGAEPPKDYQIGRPQIVP